MIFLRCLSALAGILILLFAPQVAQQFAYLVDAGDVGTNRVMLATMAASAVLSSGFFFVTVAGPSVMRRPVRRAAAAFLLAVPFAASAWVLLSSDRMPLVSFAAPLLAMSIITFSAFVWPGARRPRRRYTRIPEGLNAPASPVRSSD
ncbi:hypothetical protein [Massilia cavernae]|nr:hypothetical protein [Massilia cavernae]